jgi:hypothetical protein
MGVKSATSASQMYVTEMKKPKISHLQGGVGAEGGLGAGV